jgi:hypothetical protein
MNFKGLQTFCKNTRNSQKLYLGMVFKNINLDDITCIEIFGDSSKVSNGLKLRNLDI